MPYVADVVQSASRPQANVPACVDAASARIREWNGTQRARRGSCSWGASSSRSTSPAPRRWGSAAPPGATAAWFPAAGVGVLAVLVAPRRRWPLVLVAVTVAFALANVTVGRSLGVAALLGLADSVEVALVATLVIRFIGRRMRDVQDAWRLFAIAAAGAITAGLLISLVYWLMLDSSFWGTFGLVVPSHGAAVLLVTPLALLGLRAPGRTLGVRRVELAAQCSMLAAATLFTLAPGQLTLGFAPLPVLVWAAVRFNAWVVVIEQLVFADGGLAADPAGTRAVLGGGRQRGQQHPVRPAVHHLRRAHRPAARDGDAAAGARRRTPGGQRAGVPAKLHRVTHPDRPGHLHAGRGSRHRLQRRPAPSCCTGPRAARGSTGGRGPGVRGALRGLRGDGHGFDLGMDRPGGRRGATTDPSRGDLSLLENDEDRTSMSLHMVDVTEPLELQERLQAERDYTRSVIDTASSMIVVTDPDGTVIAANPATTTLTGFAEEELVGRPFWERLLPERPPGPGGRAVRRRHPAAHWPARRSCRPRRAVSGWWCSPPTSTRRTRTRR